MLQLRLRAPFAAFRTFTAGAYRPTAPFMPPSSAYGLLLNLAGIESRWDDGKSAMTLMRSDLPAVEIALGALVLPEVQSIYQQLHNYPVGSSGKERAADCKGNKYNIQPIRREFLSGLDAYLCCRGNAEVEDRVRLLLQGEVIPGAPKRYGIPFLGDNSFLLDQVEEIRGCSPPARWLKPLSATDEQEGTGRMRLSVTIDRADMTRTRSALFVWRAGESSAPTDDTWITIPGA